MPFVICSPLGALPPIVCSNSSRAKFFLNTSHSLFQDVPINCPFPPFYFMKCRLPLPVFESFREFSPESLSEAFSKRMCPALKRLSLLTFPSASPQPSLEPPCPSSSTRNFLFFAGSRIEDYLLPAPTLLGCEFLRASFQAELRSVQMFRASFELLISF